MNNRHDIVYPDGTMDPLQIPEVLEAHARRNDERGAYLRSVLKGARTNDGRRWDNRRRCWTEVRS